jgi:hypothetical protein
MDSLSPSMQVFVTDYEAVLRVRGPLRWHRHPGSALHGMLKRGLDRVDPAVRARLLAPVVPEPPPHFSLRAGEAAPAALFPVLPRTGTGPQGALMRDDQIPIRLRRFGPADPYIDQCIESALDSLDEALFVEPGSWRSPRGRIVAIDDRPTHDNYTSLNFITPGHLEANDRVRTDLDFPTLIKLVRRRLEAICALHGELPADTSERFRRETLPGAGRVTRVRSRLRREEWEREASLADGARRRHKMIGLLGDMAFEGPLGPFVSTLVAAQEIHIGKLTSMGLGRIAVALGLDGSPTTVLDP